ncbi:hypothetical protein SDRG_03857 [Saprolegnia diclina VS20]|uniref:ubiquitinyl hydrolase 1 n=1 Tax=Saprolegnia diclina (strain VS20) TaxID=1156394 RepID=T0QLF4_SAPDV|nr:hypothetical protein SDRG_03857 [Saprolegnia diclina VS20]EQC38899.1 hypothetical protein SDRG_03857 [Saprolegnia diclina VS20]|eukprot:XP_008607723.1 hypothetical protein SDRG_03857 [Saprolegnia diclina VS20]
MVDDELSVAGLRNLGNTCYFNAVLQALASSKRFVAHLDEICPMDDDDEATPGDDRCLAFTSVLQHYLHELSPRPRSTIGGAVEPRLLNAQLGKSIQGFRGNRQQDAEEWFQLIMELCEDEYKKTQPKGSLFDLIGRAPAESHNPFYGLSGTLLECTRCHMRKPMWTDRFLDLKLSLCGSMDGRHVFNHLRESWRHYTSMERIDGVECTNCTLRALLAVVEEQRDALASGDPMEFVDVPSLWEGGDARNVLRADVLEWRQNLLDILGTRLASTNGVCDLDMDGSGWTDDEGLWLDKNGIEDPRACRRTYAPFLRHIRLMRCPDVLAFHINRNVFLQDAMVKLDSYLRFESTLLAQDLLLDDDTKDHTYDQLVYDAIAVIVHHGNERGGHYTCYRRLAPRRWVHVSDDRVLDVPTSEVARAKAYMLFYERR